jgi:hypothetical protein
MHETTLDLQDGFLWDWVLVVVNNVHNDKIHNLYPFPDIIEVGIFQSV